MSLAKKIIFTLFCTLGTVLAQERALNFFKANHYKIEKSSISTVHDELSPQIIGDKIYYISNEPLEIGIKNFGKNHKPLYRIYYKNINSKTEKPQQLFPNYLKNLHEGPFYMNEAQDHIWFTTNKPPTKYGEGLLTIKEAVLTDKGWKVNHIPFFDSLSAAACHPTLFANETKMIFSSSLLNGSKGGMDLFQIEFINGKWMNLKNLGPNINTDANEAFPMVDKNNQLFYSSNKNSENNKKYQLYSCILNSDELVPFKLPSTFNSDSSEYGMIWFRNKNEGYFVSDKDGSCDLFSVKFLWPKTLTADTMAENKYCYEFTEESSMELEDSLVMSYEWDFGDGIKQKSASATHCFEKEGTYIISLNIVEKVTGVVFFNQVTYELEINDSFPIRTEIKNSILTISPKTQVDSLENIFIELDGVPFYSGSDSIIKINDEWRELKEYYSFWSKSKLDTVCRYRKKDFVEKNTADTLLRITEKEGVVFRIHLGESQNLYENFAENLVIKDTITITLDSNNTYHYFIGNYSKIKQAIKPLIEIKESGFEESTIVGFQGNQPINGQILKGEFDKYYMKKGYVKLYSIEYETAKFKIEKKTQLRLDSTIKHLSNYQNKTYLITSFADLTGSKKLNDKLISKRTGEVRKFLLKLGVPLANIKINIAEIKSKNPIDIPKAEETFIKASEIYVSREP